MPMRRAPAERASLSATRSSAPPTPVPRALARTQRRPNFALPPGPTRTRPGPATPPPPPHPLAAPVHGEEVERLGVEPVAVASGRQALLAAEDLVAQGDGGGELLLVAG